jgi:hypothetical protein
LWRADSGKNRTLCLIFQVQKWWEFHKVSQSTGCPLTSKTDENVDQVKKLVLKTKIIIHEVAGMLRIPFRLVKSILKDDLKMCWTCTKFKLCLMSEEQKEKCVNTFQDLQDLVPYEFFLFPKLKVLVNVWRCNDTTTIQGDHRTGSANFSLLRNASYSGVVAWCTIGSHK